MTHTRRAAEPPTTNIQLGQVLTAAVTSSISTRSALQLQHARRAILHSRPERLRPTGTSLINIAQLRRASDHYQGAPATIIILHQRAQPSISSGRHSSCNHDQPRRPTTKTNSRSNKSIHRTHRRTHSALRHQANTARPTSKIEPDQKMSKRP